METLLVVDIPHEAPDVIQGVVKDLILISRGNNIDVMG